MIPFGNPSSDELYLASLNQVANDVGNFYRAARTVKATKAISRAFALTPHVFLNAAIIILSETITLSPILIHSAVAHLYQGKET